MTFFSFSKRRLRGESIKSTFSADCRCSVSVLCGDRVDRCFLYLVLYGLRVQCYYILHSQSRFVHYYLWPYSLRTEYVCTDSMRCPSADTSPSVSGLIDKRLTSAHLGALHDPDGLASCSDCRLCREFPGVDLFSLRLISRLDSNEANLLFYEYCTSR